jgi:hypothetical protein
MPRTKPDEWFADYLRTSLPEWGRQAEAGRQEFVQTGVWFVGMAATLLALFLANRGRFDFLTFGAEKWIVFLLGTSVVLGIAQRVLALVAAGREQVARGNLLGWLIGYRTHGEEADELDDDWSAEDIVVRLRDHFDLDGAFLLEAPDALPRLRDAYQDVYEHSSTADKERLKIVAAKLGEYMDWDEVSLNEHLAQFEGQSADGTRPALSHQTWLGLSAISFFGAGFSLAAAVAVACISFLSH